MFKLKYKITSDNYRYNQYYNNYKLIINEYRFNGIMCIICFFFFMIVPTIAIVISVDIFKRIRVNFSVSVLDTEPITLQTVFIVTYCDDF